MVIVVIESGICVGVYQHKESEEGMVAIVDLDAASSGDSPMSVMDIEEFGEMDAKAKRIYNRVFGRKGGRR